MSECAGPTTRTRRECGWRRPKLPKPDRNRTLGKRVPRGLAGFSWSFVA
jgi:hypothetical protein